jgi:polyhydroxybutyrate depolymerase
MQRYCSVNMEKNMRLSLWLLALLLALPFVSKSRAEEIRVGGEVRTYELVLPSGVSGPAPVVLVLHGGKGGARQLRRYTDMDKAASRVGAATVYPDGLDSFWNDGRIGRDGGLLHASEDVAFLDTLIARLVADKTVDPQHIYLAGVSNGGMMAIRMSCESKHKIAGIAVIAAGYPVGLKCQSNLPVQVMQFMGTDDPLAPFTGGPIKSRGDRGAVKSAKQTFDYFLVRNRCNGTRSRNLPDTDPGDGTRVTLKTGTNCEGAETQQFVIEDGGHSWPGAKPVLKWLLGMTSQDISASDIIAREFLER